MRLKSDKIQENNLGLKLMNYIIEENISLKDGIKKYKLSYSTGKKFIDKVKDIDPDLFETYKKIKDKQDKIRAMYTSDNLTKNLGYCKFHNLDTTEKKNEFTIRLANEYISNNISISKLAKNNNMNYTSLNELFDKRLNLIDEELFIKVKLKKATNKKHGRSINKESKKENKKESNLEYQKYLDTLQKELRNKNKII